MAIRHHDAASKQADERHYAECGTCRSILTIGGDGTTHYKVPIDVHDVLVAVNECVMDMQFAYDHIEHPRSVSTDKYAVLDMLKHGIERMKKLANGHALYPTLPNEPKLIDYHAHIINDAQKDALFALLAPNLLLNPDSETFKATSGILFALDPHITNGLLSIKRILEEEDKW